ncbi:enoyl-CoA hydratase/isomerase family protein [Frankia sp. AgB1.9]|uniref:enoyl-CoA hydratase/isomerase family protein n=1 Tax=unclassified Frankia TaxID=2632575 RepID=UPI0019349384|nr:MULTISPECIES: enoyl-CoA hydratase/isomerase family protein [unclassified Frankia]MBL7492155.1 enoyl-CoA hydratase/isomerase family protein [Frankia sp. AgW1.1]MBL7547852.1 enoyl-CoA hydratase/isomerase family protein [Frankia sp. AgB1.9]MBL7622022.1 enoyl-CoA hydratase/isomerase family protein [Frankia sp. AgB1.8]
MGEGQTRDGRVLLERDESRGIARLTLDNPARRNAYDPAMRAQLAAHLDDLADDDTIKVVILRGSDDVFSTGADMGNAYAWYGAGTNPDDNAARSRRPSQRRRLTVDRRSFDFYHQFLGYPKVTVAEVNGYALGGGFELALMADISVIGATTRIGMPATRFLGPALGSLHMFFHRLGPVTARRLLLTGDIIPAADLAHLGIFTEVVDDDAVTARAEHWARKAAKMPADGITIAKEAFRLVEQLQAYQGEETTSYLIHAYGTNLRFEDDEFNFVKTRAQHGTKKAFQLRDAHFDITDEPLFTSPNGREPTFGAPAG